MPDGISPSHVSNGIVSASFTKEPSAAGSSNRPASPIIVQLMGHSGIIVEVSDGWLDVLGYERAAVLGRHYGTFITPATKQVAEALHIPKLMAEGETQEFECEFVKASGATVSMIVLAESATDSADGRVLLIQVGSPRHGPTDRMLQGIARATATVTGDSYFQTLVSQLVEGLGVRAAFVTECANRELTRVRTLAYFKDNAFCETIEYDLAGTPCQGVISGAVGYYPQQLETIYPSEVGMEAYLGIPFFDSQGDILGHLAILDTKPLHCSIQDLALLEIFAARSGAELECQYKSRALQQRTQELDALHIQLQDENQRLEQVVTERTREIEQRQRVAETLRVLMTVLNSSQELREVLQVSLEKATQLLGAAWGTVYLQHQAQARLAVDATHGLAAAGIDNAALHLGQNLVHQAITKRQPVVSTSSGVATGATPLSPVGQTLLAIPLLRQEKSSLTTEAYGGIILGYLLPRDFSDDEIQLAVAFSVQAALVIENARLREQVEQVAVQEERSRLARELHDSVTQSLYSLTLLAEGRRRLIEAGHLDDIGDALADISQLSQQALKEMRLLVYELRPPLLEKESLLGALQQRLNTVEKRAGIDVRLSADLLTELPSVLEVGLYRIAQEALNNALKHASATAIAIALHPEGDHVILELIDNGIGFDLDAASGAGGMGLRSMDERAAKLGGSVTILSAAGHGTTIRVRVPLKNPLEPDAL